MVTAIELHGAWSGSSACSDCLFELCIFLYRSSRSQPNNETNCRQQSLAFLLFTFILLDSPCFHSHGVNLGHELGQNFIHHAVALD